MKKISKKESDRRVFPRLSNQRIPVTPFKVVSIPLDRGRGESRDLSFGGIGVSTVKHLRVGDRVSFGLKLSKGRSLELVEGVVKWIKKGVKHYTVGIQFTKLRMVDKLTLIAFLDRSNRSSKRRSS